MAQTLPPTMPLSQPSQVPHPVCGGVRGSYHITPPSSPPVGDHMELPREHPQNPQQPYYYDDAGDGGYIGDYSESDAYSDAGMPPIPPVSELQQRPPSPMTLKNSQLLEQRQHQQEQQQKHREQRHLEEIYRRKNGEFLQQQFQQQQNVYLQPE